MFDLVTDTLVTYLRTLQVDDGDLAGVKLVQKSDANVPTQQHPAVTVEWDGDTSFVDNGNHVDITGKFALTVYVVSLQGRAEAARGLQDILLRWGADATGKDRFMGLLPALWRVTGWEDTASGQSFFLGLSPDVKTGEVVSNTNKFYTVGAIIDATVRTLMSPSRYGGQDA